MVILEKNRLVPVYCYMQYGDAFFVYSESGYKTLYCTEALDGPIPKVYEGQYEGKVVEFYSSIPEITLEIYKKMLSDDYSSKEEGEKYKSLIFEIELTLDKHSKNILKAYYMYKIRKGEMELWNNSFENQVIQINDEEYYIDDDEYEIFYTVTKDGVQEFKFLDK